MFLLICPVFTADRSSPPKHQSRASREKEEPVDEGWSDGGGWDDGWTPTESKSTNKQQVCVISCDMNI